MKTNTKVFLKAMVKGLTEGWPGLSYIVLRNNPIVPGERPLLAIGSEMYWRARLLLILLLILAIRLRRKLKRREGGIIGRLGFTAMGDYLMKRDV